MFKKDFVVKKNENLRSSDARKLINRFPPDIAAIFDKKEQPAMVKVSNFNNLAITLYTFNKIPLVFEVGTNATLFPTIFLLWRSINKFPSVVVHENVFQYIENGADLMLPGIIQRFPFPKFNKGDAVAVYLLLKDNGGLQGPVAVGSALTNSQEMIANKFQGKGLQIVHWFRDHLCALGNGEKPPTHGEDILSALPQPPLANLEVDFPALSLTTHENGNIDDKVVGNTQHDVANVQTDAEESNVSNISEEPLESMESLLERCFLAALKFRLKKSGTLPMDVGQFYASLLLKCVPEGRRLDMKATKFKKFATFLTEINKIENVPIVKLVQKQKGVDLISEVNWDHPLFRLFKQTDEVTSDEVTAKESAGPVITEYFSITEPVMTLFKFSGASKGMLVDSSAVRDLVTQYVKEKNLSTAKSVRLDALLSAASGIGTETADWNTLMQKIQARMTRSFVIKLPDGRELVRKVNIPKIVFKVESRAGNKKVTLVSNLAVFGLNIKDFCHRIQQGVATSATSTPEVANCEGPQITVQGNQVLFVGDLLQNYYGINKKFIDGLDLAPKKRK